MKTQELITIFKKYLNEEVRLIIREEIKLAFKELAKEQIKTNVNEIKKVPGTTNLTQIVKKPVPPVQRQPVKPIVRTGNTALDAILVETHRSMVSGGDDTPMVDEREIQALLTGGPVNNTISRTTHDIQIPSQSQQTEYSEEVNIISQLETVDSGQVPSVEDFINMKR